MSESHALGALKAHAKQMLAAARAGDQVVIAKLRELLPRLATLSNADLVRDVLLADVQHAVARKHGLSSWAELKRKIEAVDPMQAQADRFLRALREHQHHRAVELLAKHPDIAHNSIHAAAAACNVRAVREFIERDALLVSKSDSAEKYQPIIYAAGTPLPALDPQLRDANTACVRLLLEHGASAATSVQFDDGGQQSELSALYFACTANNIGAARLLLEHGADPNDGESVYHAAEYNHRECLELLLQHGANISDRHPRWDNTPLYFLAGFKELNPLHASSEMGMRWLLEHGANPNIRSYVGIKSRNLPTREETPLHRVVSYGRSVECVRMLVEHGADIDLARGDGKTAYALAFRSANNAAEYLASIGANIDTLTPADELLNACAVADEARARKIVSMHPALMAALTAEDRQVLTVAAEDGNEQSARLMVSLGWSLSDEAPWGGTPLHHAAWHGRAATTRLFIELGAQINYRDSAFGSSPIAWAAHGSANCRKNHDDEYCEVIDLLIAAGSSRVASYNKWAEAPENLSSKAVAAFLKQRGFTP
ncbi:MAG: ankyrin repeat domain-containing protein [Gemmatimonadota bacterium]|nr:ankyrin repeat domain-containing protein [Gemmatimonadota bacterium]